MALPAEADTRTRILEGALRRLKLPVSAQAIACWTVDFWAGIKFEMLLGIEDRVAHLEEALELTQLLLKRLEVGASQS